MDSMHLELYLRKLYFLPDMYLSEQTNLVFLHCEKIEERPGGDFLQERSLKMLEGKGVKDAWLKRMNERLTEQTQYNTQRLSESNQRTKKDSHLNGIPKE